MPQDYSSYEEQKFIDVVRKEIENAAFMQDSLRYRSLARELKNILTDINMFPSLIDASYKYGIFVASKFLSINNFPDSEVVIDELHMSVETDQNIEQIIEKLENNQVTRLKLGSFADQEYFSNVSKETAQRLSYAFKCNKSLEILYVDSRFLNNVLNEIMPNIVVDLMESHSSLIHIIYHGGAKKFTDQQEKQLVNALKKTKIIYFNFSLPLAPPKYQDLMLALTQNTSIKIYLDGNAKTKKYNNYMLLRNRYISILKTEGDEECAKWISDDHKNFPHQVEMALSWSRVFLDYAYEKKAVSSLIVTKQIQKNYFTVYNCDETKRQHIKDANISILNTIILDDRTYISFVKIIKNKNTISDSHPISIEEIQDIFEISRVKYFSLSREKIEAIAVMEDVSISWCDDIYYITCPTILMEQLNAIIDLRSKSEDKTEEPMDFTGREERRPGSHVQIKS